MRAAPATGIPVKTTAPWKGLNTVDALAAMPPEYGLSIQNFIASPQGLTQRQGYRKWATDLPTTTSTLIPFNARASAGNKFFAVAGGSIYDITNGGAVGAPVVSGLNAARPYWQFSNQSHGSGATNYLIAVNGSDAPLLYNGTSWTTCSQTATPLNPGEFSTADSNGNAVNIQTFVDVVLHYQRLWFVAENTTKAYYLDIAAAGGELHPFDFGPLFSRGGFLHKLATWTMDSGNGIQSMLVAYSSKGDCVVFGGNDPANASTWSLIGTYVLGSPIGRRCTTQMAGDLFYLSQDGMFPMSKYIQSARVDSTSALTYYISPTISDLVSAFGSLPGFEATVYPGRDLMMLNIPQSVQANNFQFCYQTINQGWTQFTGWPAQCFGLFNDALYFGGPNYVAIAFIGYKDDAEIDGSGGNNIVATALTAFTTMNMSGLKHAKLVKPYIVTGQSNPTIRIGVNTDFNLVPIVGSATVNPVTGAVWDNALWDDPDATWVGSLTAYNQWATPLCWDAEYLAFAISLSAVSDTTWTSTGWVITQPGSAFG